MQEFSSDGVRIAYLDAPAAAPDRGAPHGIRTTVISPGAVAAELPNSVTEADVAASVAQFYEAYAIPADSFARMVAFAMSQPDDVDVNEILFRPTRQEL